SSTTNLQLYSYSFTRQRPDGSVIDTLTIRIRGQVVGWDGPDYTVFGHLTVRINGQDNVLFRFGRYITGGAIAQADMELQIELDRSTCNKQRTAALAFVRYVSSLWPSRSSGAQGIVH